MLRAIHTAATGMEAMQTNIDNVANNMANVNTNAFKKGTAEFQDLYYQTIRAPGTQVTAETIAPTGVQIGVGVKTMSVHKDFTPGSAKVTGQQFDFLINGDGFFQVQKENGEPAWTRDGAFKVDNQGRMVTSSGLLVQPPITIPPNTSRVAVSPTGLVTSIDTENRSTQVGQIEISNFINPAGLSSEGGNLYKTTDASGPPVQGIPGNGGLGNIQQYSLESSNVNVVNEMVNMIQAQRAYEMNSKVMQAADQMMQVSTNVLK
jgi:flagellar basal-body rod protein FlgG